MPEAAELREVLDLPEAALPWLKELTTLDPAAIALPDDTRAAADLDRLAFTEADRRDALAARPPLDDRPELQWLLDRCHAQLVDDIGGTPNGMLPWPQLGGRLGAVGRFFYVWVLLSVLDDIRSWHAERGVSDEASWEILADLGRQVSVHRRIFGTGGLHTQNWMTLHSRGVIYSFGRLQFERVRLQVSAPAADLAGGDLVEGEHALSVHIPDAGPFRPADCDESFARAREFFPRYFPAEPARVAICHSWLLDPQLADYLPAESNIVRFQRRFTLTENRRSGDRSVLEFVFRHLGTDTTGLPRESTLQRAILDHLDAGQHWEARIGWVAMA